MEISGESAEVRKASCKVGPFWLSRLMWLREIRSALVLRVMDGRNVE